MGLPLKIMLLISSTFCCLAAESTTEEIEVKQADSTLYFREELLSLRGEMYSLVSQRAESALLALHVTDLLKNVRAVMGSMDRLESKIDTIAAEQARQIEAVDAKVDLIRSDVDLIRSEVRLISQHKLTWQNSSWDDTFHSDFLVDGIYTLSAGYDSDNPVYHPGRGMNLKNNMVIIDLGGFFKIHTIKLWNRIDEQPSYAIGVLIYVDDDLIGTIHDVQRLYNILAGEEVYGSKIFVKQSLAKFMNFIEIQVFGSGPYRKKEMSRKMF